MGRDVRDRFTEQAFFAIYGSPVLQGLLGIRAVDGPVRQLPSTSPQRVAERKAKAEAYAEQLNVGGFDEAFIRALIYVFAAERALDERCALAMNVARQQLLHLSLADFKTLMRDQFFELVLERERAIEALGTLIPVAEKRQELLAHVNAIVTAAGKPTTSERDRLTRLEKALGKSPKAVTGAGPDMRSIANEGSDQEPSPSLVPPGEGERGSGRRRRETQADAPAAR
jgi:hypothetical protein